MGRSILTINGGSSSVKFAFFGASESGDAVERRLAGSIQRIGLPDARLRIRDRDGKTLEDRSLEIADASQAATILIDSLKRLASLAAIAAIGHRIVHGGPNYLDHAPITSGMLAELRRLAPIDPDHLPGEIALIEAFAAHLPGKPEIACFDTAFHRDLPHVARRLPIPQTYDDAGIRRYGFHGLSYAYLMEELARQVGTDAANRRVILAHLGAGASMAAVKDGRCIDTTMSFTPTAGLVMATRVGDLDPGVLVYLMRQEKLTADQLDELINKKSGLLGVSGSTSDMRDLLAQRATNRRAALAFDLFCYQARKWIGALAAALGGLDTLAFSGGIGENSPEIRAQICAELGYLGAIVDAAKNEASASVISTSDSRVAVRVIPTDEELMIANIIQRMLAEPDRKSK
jgi:acetate kinase